MIMLPACWIFGAFRIHNLVLDVWLNGIADKVEMESLC